MHRTWILTAVGKDRPGIVANVTKILYELGCNLDDSTMTRLGGEFAMMVMFSAPAKLGQRQLERACQPLAHRLHLAVHLEILTPPEIRSVSRGKPYLISVYGADRPGIVYRVSALLARAGINITDVATHRTSGQQGGRFAWTRRKTATPLYLMILEVELPRRITASHLERQLRRLATQLGVEVALRSAEPHLL